METSCLVRARECVLKLALSGDEGLWVATTASDMDFWHIKPVLEVGLIPIPFALAALDRNLKTLVCWCEVAV